MNEVKRDALKPEEELVDVLLDFIIVSATLAKKVTLAVREKQIKEGAYCRLPLHHHGTGGSTALLIPIVLFSFSTA